MAKRVEALVKPELLRWARRSAGLTEEDTARRTQVKVDAIRSWESGTSRPSVPQLRKLGRVYHRPIGVFYLPEPPRDFTALHDFRRVFGTAAPPPSQQLLLQMRLAQSRRELLAELYSELSAEPPLFSLTADIREEPETVAQRIRNYLQVTVKLQAAWRPGRETMNNWRRSFEESGILVFQMTDVSLDEARGFSVSSDTLPAVIVNVKDAVNARTFTMLHELGHLALRQAGLCNLSEDISTIDSEDIEVFCNAVAGATLVPEADLSGHTLFRSHSPGAAWPDSDIEQLSTEFRCSREVVVRRLLHLGRVTSAFYESKRNQYQREYTAVIENERRKGSGQQDPARKAVSNLGNLYVRTVLDAFHDETIHAGQLADLLGTRLKHLNKIEKMVAST